MQSQEEAKFTKPKPARPSLKLTIKKTPEIIKMDTNQVIERMHRLEQN